MHMRRRSGSFPGGIANPGKFYRLIKLLLYNYYSAARASISGASGGASSSRHQSIVEAAEAHFDKNTIILCINLIILTVLMALLYVVATSAQKVTSS